MIHKPLVISSEADLIKYPVYTVVAYVAANEHKLVENSVP